MTNCVFCNDELDEEVGNNNAQPIIDGRCCDDCNSRIVIPFRIKASQAFEQHKKDILETFGLEDKD